MYLFIFFNLLSLFTLDVDEGKRKRNRNKKTKMKKMKFFLTNFWTWDRLSSADAWQLPRRGRSGHEQLRRFRYSLSKNFWAEKKKKGGRERPTATTVTEHISYTQTRDRKTNKSNHKGGKQLLDTTPKAINNKKKGQRKKRKRRRKNQNNTRENVK